jgi:hypothetical protein
VLDHERNVGKSFVVFWNERFLDVTNEGFGETFETFSHSVCARSERLRERDAESDFLALVNEVVEDAHILG